MNNEKALRAALEEHLAANELGQTPGHILDKFDACADDFLGKMLGMSVDRLAVALRDSFSYFTKDNKHPFSL